MKLSLFDDVLAVMVLYQKRVAESQTFLSLAKCLDGRSEKIDVVLYDNSPMPMWHDNEKQYSGFRIHYISDTSNPGVSKAYNAGFELARQLRKKWLLLLDQDTAFPEEALTMYAAAIEKYAEPPLIAPMLVCDGRIYSPCHHVVNVNFPLRTIRPGIVTTKGLSILNSGLCIRLDAFEKAGGFDERIPLDFADHDFMRRYRRYFDSFVLLDMVCAHNFSDKEVPDVDKAFVRFGFYCRGAKNSIRGCVDAVSLFMVAFVRAQRLSARFKDPRFFPLLFTTFFRN